MKSILEGNGGISHVDEQFIIGALSLVIWTVTLLTTIKYVIIAMKADNHGEGGIFSLFSGKITRQMAYRAGHAGRSRTAG